MSATGTAQATPEAQGATGPEPLVIPDPATLQRVMRADYPVSDEQWRAVSAPLEPTVVIAGAGSGKTTLMAARVVYLVATGQVRPEQILGLTFTTKAARELATRVREALAVAGLGPGRPGAAGAGAGAGPHEGDDEAGETLEPTVATYNAYAASLLTEHGLRIGHEPDTRVMADASRYQLAERVIARHRRPVELLSDHPATVVGNIVALEGALSEHLVTGDDVRAFHAREAPRFRASLETSRARADLEKVLNVIGRREELLDLVGEYRALKAGLGLMDFSDQIALAARLADDHPDVGAAERAKYAVVLLDEYQDTSVAQALLLSRLFSGPTPDAGRGHPVTAVGDPNQAIYGWRGASVSNILGFGRDFPAADGSEQVATHTLTVNRRSDRRILAAANRLAAPLYAAYAGVQPLRAPDGAAEGVVRVAVHDTYADELTALGDEVLAAHGRGTPWREIGVLTRDNSHAADVFDALTSRDVPVEIVGLSGLLRLPEVAEVVATLTLLHDLTANASALTLLTGPRWAIGPRDLAVLGRRARDLAAGDVEGDLQRSVEEALAVAVEGADPTEISSLCDALESPGEAPEYPYSAEARTRIGLLAGELRMLRGHAGEPLLDLVRRIVEVGGIDVELASSTSPSASARRDNLDLFLRAVGDFQAVDGDVGLGALLAYLTAEDELGTGLDVATPTEADSVKLLTVHRAKGLEWDVVFCVGVGEDKFPTKQTRTQWITGPAVLPSPLRGDAHDVPQLRGYEKADIDELKAAARAHEAAEELRLGYVAFTRARHLLVASAYLWTDSRASPVGPSAYLATLREELAAHGEDAERWVERPAKGTPNPLREERDPVPWPVVGRTTEAERRVAAAALVRVEQERLREEGPRALAEQDHDLDLVGIAEVGEWDAEIDRLLAEARRSGTPQVEVAMPTSISATSVARLRDAPEEMARELARPMPRPPSSAARFGTRFHAWVEARFGQQSLIPADEVPGRGDLGIDGDDDLAEVIAAFEAGPFADRVPLATETPFALVLAGQVVRGRIDAVFAGDGTTHDHLVVDWKTGRDERADPLQLALYRLAWAEIHGVDPDRVRAAFVFVRSGRVVEPGRLAGRAELERLVGGEGLAAR
ncbi:ATP-dependent DNA helicase [Nocardioides zeae]|uniref:DNA 3'-5' helicase n=1 Tax=Nocardioides imazamoxiresistens TaxID=3231893 RepID=A0ABU3PX00_9ACTN|nr:ATP-dependent DNA helicase [Nocardioides zeae]MDT9593767.1 ATP-dependent DNA helicase [Nocardioides zeae]